MPLGTEDVPATPTGRSSADYGEPSEFARQRRALESVGSPGQPQQPPGLTPGAMPPQQGPQPAEGSPVQPSPQRTPLSPADLQPGGPVFMQPKMYPRYPWRQELRLWARHPDAGPFLAQLSQRADAGLNQHPAPRKDDSAA